ncbi:MAG: hypothetical protein ACOVQX_04095 [Legionella sp.]
MNLKLQITVFLSVMIYLSSICYGEDLILPAFLPTDAKHANWSFSGLVTNESGDLYSYFFEMQRDGQQYQIYSALFDGQTKKPIFIEQDSAIIEQPNVYNWRVGRAFLRFNPINDSWIFGLTTADKKGFNFKVDMLNQSTSNYQVQKITSNISFFITQTSHLNGHIYINSDKSEQFVMANQAWFRQVWQIRSQQNLHPVTGLFCRFDDGHGFYSMNILEESALQGAVTGACDMQGNSIAISQFINVTDLKNSNWHIDVTSPSHHLLLENLLDNPSLVAGFVSEKGHDGFCLLSNDLFYQSTKTGLTENFNRSTKE